MIRTILQLWILCLLAAAPLSAQPPRATTATEQGIAALKAGMLNDAEELFQQARRAGGATALLHHNLGVIRQQRGRHAEAVAEFRQAVKLQSDSGESHLLLGVSLLALGNNAAAIPALQLAVKLIPREAQARWQLARACERTDHWVGAVEQYQALTEMKPQEPEYLYQLGRAYSRLSEWSYQRIISLNPDAARLHQALGQQYLAQGKYELALAEYRRAAQVDPRLPEIHLAIAIIHLDQRNLAEAGREIALELQLAPESRKAMEVRRKIEAAASR